MKSLIAKDSLLVASTLNAANALASPWEFFSGNKHINKINEFFAEIMKSYGDNKQRIYANTSLFDRWSKEMKRFSILFEGSDDLIKFITDLKLDYYNYKEEWMSRFNQVDEKLKNFLFEKAKLVVDGKVNTDKLKLVLED